MLYFFIIYKDSFKFIEIFFKHIKFKAKFVKIFRFIFLDYLNNKKLKETKIK